MDQQHQRKTAAPGPCGGTVTETWTQLMHAEERSLL
jgi:hypothetical protein